MECYTRSNWPAHGWKGRLIRRLPHARRKFTDVTRALGKKRKAGAADKALSYIRKLYAVEKRIKNDNYSPEEIYAIRQAESRPILDDFEKWLRKKQQQTPPKGLLAKPWPIP